jgi:hypothetical protein
MYIFVSKQDNIIVGCSVKLVNESEVNKQGNNLFYIDDADFSYDMIGQQITDFELE